MTQTTTSARRRRAVALVAALLVALGTLAGAAAAAPCAVDVAGSWRTINPSFPEGPAQAVSFSTMPTDPDVLFVANDRSVVRSNDGGCSWHDAVRLSELGFAAGDRIVQVEVVPDDAGRVYAIVQQAGSIPRPHVILSTNGGALWRRGDGGLEAAFGAPRKIAPARDDGPIYLLTGPADVSLGDTRVATAWGLYRSLDHGLTWERRLEIERQVVLDPLVAQEPQDVRDLVVDPFEENDLWLFGPSGLYRSRDGGGTLTESIGGTAISAVTIFKSFSAQPLTVAYEADAKMAHPIVGDGTLVTNLPVPAVFDGAATGRDTYEQVLTTALGDVIHATSIQEEFLNISPAVPAYDPRTSTVNAGRDLVVQARTKLGVVRRLLPGPLVVGPGEPPPIDLPDGSFRTPQLRPGRPELLLGPGERRRMPVRLFLPGNPRVDVFFLIDTSGSMGEEIDGVRAAIAAIQHDLVEAGLDVWFGLGQYRGMGGGFEPAYQRVQDLRPPSGGISEALGEIGAFGTGPESMLPAMRQVAVGDGIPDADPPVPPGQQAHFRPGALPVILHLGDETFSDGGRFGSIEDVGATLASAGILQVGLAFQRTAGLLPRAEGNPRAGMEAMARLTGALAPASGADCDGDDAADRQSGDPMVCVIDPARSAEASVIAPAIVGLLVGLAKDPVNVTVEADAPDGVVVGDRRQVLPNIDFTINQQRGYYVTVACPETALGRRIPVQLRALGREAAELARGAFSVVCGVRPPPPPPPPVPPILAQIPPAPQPVPQQGPQSQPQGHAQGAFAAQRQQQPQLAYGYVNPNRAAPNPAPAREDRFEMSSATDPAAVPPAATYLTGAAMAVAAVALARRRTRTATVPARAGRGRTTHPPTHTPRRNTWR